MSNVHMCILLLMKHKMLKYLLDVAYEKKNSYEIGKKYTSKTLIPSKLTEIKLQKPRSKGE